jgi:hypothetical protein
MRYRNTYLFLKNINVDFHQFMDESLMKVSYSFLAINEILSKIQIETNAEIYIYMG